MSQTTETQSPDSDARTSLPADLSVLGTAYVQALYQFFRLTLTHEPTNAIFQKVLTEVCRVQNLLLTMPGAFGMQLNIRGEMIFINSKALRPRPRQFKMYRHLVKLLKSRRIGGIKISSEPAPSSVLSVLWSISKAEEQKNAAAEINEFLRAQGISQIEVEPILGSKNSGNDGADGETISDTEMMISALYNRLVKFVEVAIDNRARAKEFDLQRVSETLQELVLLADDDLVPILRLASLKRYPRPLPYRGANACFLMAAWARSLQLPMAVVAELSGAALAHILTVIAAEDKTPGERMENKILEMVGELAEVWPMTDLQKLALLEWRFMHGEQGVYEVEGVRCYAHFFSRMCRIVALFEEMTTYQKGVRVYLPDEAIAELSKKDQIQVDPTLFKLFVNWIGIYPIGTLVELQSGEIGQIFAAASDPLKFQRPMVLILRDAAGAWQNEPEVVDLAELNPKLGIFKKNIKSSIRPEDAQIPADYFLTAAMQTV